MQNRQTTYKNTEIGLIPEDWEVKELGKYSFITKLAGFEYSLHFNSYKDTGEIIVIRGTNITHNKLDLSDIRTIPRKTSNFLLRSKLYKNDLVFAYVGTIGPIFLVEEDDRFHLGPNTSKITVNKELNSRFLFHYFTSSYLKKEIIEHTSIGAQPSLSMSKIRSFKIIVPPSLTEQKAIATALSDTDALISSLEKLISKKRAITQGAMQELLKPKDGWEVKKLGDVAEIKKGQLITDKTRIDGSIPVIAGGKKPAYFHNLPNRLGKTITISGSGASAGYVSFHAYPIYASDCSTIEESLKYSIEFLYFYLIFKQSDIYNMQTGGAQPHVHPTDLNPLKLYLPNKNEQTRIATILSEMDTEIQKLENKLNKYKQIKQGMMQQLLTGKIRLV